MNVATVRHIDEAAIRPLSLDEVLRMVEAGIIDEDERVELVDGVLVEMSPEGIHHVEVIADLTWVLRSTYPRTYDVRIQSTYPLDEWQFKQPDLVLSHRIRGRWLQPGDVVLVIEVAQTSLRYDTGRKARDYAGWGVASYWVVDVDRRRLLVHREPAQDGYRVVEEVSESIPIQLPDVDTVFTLAEVLPPPNPA